MRVLGLARRLGLVALIASALAGCQTLGADGLVASTAPPELSGPAASAIAGDMVTKLAEQIGPGTATIALKPDGSPFGQALETSLRSWGYAVARDQKTDAGKTIALAYVIQPYDGQVLARLSTAELELGRAYSPTAAGASPTSPLSVLRRG